MTWKIWVQNTTQKGSDIKVKHTSTYQEIEVEKVFTLKITLT